LCHGGSSDYGSDCLLFFVAHASETELANFSSIPT
jgi:hypothetical protein